MSGSDESGRRAASRRRQRGIFERPRGSGVWWVRYHDEQGREHREKVGLKGLAAKVYQKRKTEIQERRFFPEAERPWDAALEERIADYLARRTSTLRDPVGAERYGRYLREASELRGKTMRALTTQDFERYRERRRREGAPGARRRRAGASASTVNKELSFARAVFNDFIEALEDRGLPPISNPIRTRLFAPEPPGRTRYLKEREEDRLRTAIGDEHWPKIVVAMHSGLDRGAEFALRWEQLDFQTRIIHAERRKGRRDGITPVTVAINDELLAVLRALPSRLNSSWVFPNADGSGPLDGDEFDRRVFQPALVRAGINKVIETKETKGVRAGRGVRAVETVRRQLVRTFRWKDLRHTFASRLRMTGVELGTIRDLLGHTTTRMTERYAHIAPGYLHDAVQRISRTGTTTGTSECSTEEPARAAGGNRAPAREKSECPRRDSNPRYRRERPTS
jgi:hypothetical protein